MSLQMCGESVSHRFSTVRDWNRHHRDFIELYYDVPYAERGLKPPVPIETTCTCIAKSSLLVLNVTKYSAT